MVFERFAHSNRDLHDLRCHAPRGTHLRAFRRGAEKSGRGARAPPPKKDREQSRQATRSFLRLVLCSLPPCEQECVTLAKVIAAHGTRLPRHPKIKEITNSTRNIKNRSFAMPADAAAIPPNPKTAATSAMIRNITAQPNIPSPPHRLVRICRLTRVPLHACSR
jgi:hypothetical protein